jgi:hypothetical protein
MWLDRAGQRPNVLPGLLGVLSERYGREVAGPDLMAYVAGVAAHPWYVARFAEDLSTPGLRLPVTADAEIFGRVVTPGRRVIWLHTFGTRFVDATHGRAATTPRAPDDRRPKVVATISDDPEKMPEEIDYDDATKTISVGEGRITPVTRAAWDYEVSGYVIVRRWFARRKRRPEGRKSSPLDGIHAARWDPSWTSELLEILNVIELLVELEPVQSALLAEVLSGPLISVEELRTAGVLPCTAPPQPERPPRHGQGQL